MPVVLSTALAAVFTYNVNQFETPITQILSFISIMMAKACLYYDRANFNDGDDDN